MTATPFNNHRAGSCPGSGSFGDGILRLPLRLQRDLILLFVVKLAMLGLLYLLFFSPAHRPDVDMISHITGH